MKFNSVLESLSFHFHTFIHRGRGGRRGGKNCGFPIVALSTNARVANVTLGTLCLKRVFIRALEKRNYILNSQITLIRGKGRSLTSAGSGDITAFTATKRERATLCAKWMSIVYCNWTEVVFYRLRLLKANEMQNGVGALQLDSIANAPRNYCVDYKFTGKIKRDRYIARCDLHR